MRIKEVEERLIPPSVLNLLPLYIYDKVDEYYLIYQANMVGILGAYNALFSNSRISLESDFIKSLLSCGMLDSKVKPLPHCHVNYYHGDYKNVRLIDLFFTVNLDARTIASEATVNRYFEYYRNYYNLNSLLDGLGHLPLNNTIFENLPTPFFADNSEIRFYPYKKHSQEDIRPMCCLNIYGLFSFPNLNQKTILEISPKGFYPKAKKCDWESLTMRNFNLTKNALFKFALLRNE